MSNNYDQFWARIQRQRQAASGNRMSNAHLIAYLESDLIRRLASEMQYGPKSPVAFARELRERQAESSAAQSERMRTRERTKTLREKYLSLESEQLAILENSDPYRMPVASIILAQSTLQAARWYLQAVPEDSTDDGTALDITGEDYRLATIEKLKAWRSRLRVELGRIVEKINELDPESIDLDSLSARYSDAGRLLDDLDCVTRAIDDASENLKVVNLGKPVSEFAYNVAGIKSL